MTNFLGKLDAMLSFGDEEAPSPPPPPTTTPHPEVVELATLELPSTALENGLELGEGNHVVLEASNEIVEQIQSAQQQQKGDNNNNNAEPPTISAVVNLETLAELAGTTEREFITGLHQEIMESRAAAAALQQDFMEQDDCNEQHDSLQLGETTPLISHVSYHPPTEELPQTTTEQITLPADPFLETLADALAHCHTDDDHSTIASITGRESLAGTTIAAASVIVSDTAGLLSGEEPEEQHFAHDAFLLDVPTTDEQGNTEHHYVLALPEIVVEASVATDNTSAISHGSGNNFKMLEKAMSILPDTRLPTDIETVRLEATEHQPTKEDPTQVHLDLVVQRRVPWIGYLILFAGLFALSSVGAALDLQRGGVTPTMKTVWRQSATFFVYSPMVVKALLREGLPNLTKKQWVLLPLSSMAYTYMTLAFVVSLEWTSMANAFVLSNMTSLVIIAGRAILGLPIMPLEGYGAMTGFIGALICAQAAGGQSVLVGEEMTMSFWGNLIAFSASFGVAAYLLIAKDLRPKMDLFVFMSIIMGLGALLLIPYIYFTGEVMTFDTHPAHGIFGWLHWKADRLPLEMYMAIVCNCLGTTGYIAVMKYFDPIVPATVMLLEPVIGALLGVAVRTASMPGLQTWLGDVVVAAGTFMVIYAGSSKKESIDATEALRHRSGTTILDGEDHSTVTKSPLIPRHSRSSALPPVDEKRPQTDEVAKVIWSSE